MALTDNFSFITVMDLHVFEYVDSATETNQALVDAVEYPGGTGLPTPVATIDSLTISNITQEGPRKESRGGLYAKPIVRYGKTMRLDMEDAVANKLGLQYLAGANYDDTANTITVDETFEGPKTLVGKTFVVDRATGNREWTYIVFRKFLPDSIFDLTMESEGDIGVMNLGGELFPDADGAFFVMDVLPSETEPV